jgi:hypothetical protein
MIKIQYSSSIAQLFTGKCKHPGVQPRSIRRQD